MTYCGCVISDLLWLVCGHWICDLLWPFKQWPVVTMVMALQSVIYCGHGHGQSVTWCGQFVAIQSVTCWSWSWPFNQWPVVATVMAIQSVTCGGNSYGHSISDLLWPWSWPYNQWLSPLYSCQFDSCRDKVYLKHDVKQFVSDLWQVVNSLQVLSVSSINKMHTLQTTIIQLKYCWKVEFNTLNVIYIS